MPIARRSAGAGQPGDLGDFGRQRAAVGVAEHDDVRAGPLGGLQRRQGMRAVFLEAVEAVLGIVDDEFAVLLQKAHGVGDHREVLVGRGLQDLADVQQRGLAEDGHDRRVGFDQQPHLLVVFGRDVLAPRRPEGGEPRVA